MAVIRQDIGLKRVLANMQKAKVKTELGLRAGLLAGALYVQRESQLRVPVDTGNLKGSAFTRFDPIGGKPSYIIGYTAAYAVYVHESLGMKLAGEPRKPRYIAGDKVGGKGRYWDPQGRAGPKFLENVVREDKDKIREIVVRWVKRLGGDSARVSA